MVTEFDVSKARREELRWLAVLTLNNARPLGADESLVLTVARARFADVTPLELRKELDYLADRELVSVIKRPDGRWHCELTRHGVDLAEYTVDCQPGIARPEKYW